MKSENNEQRYFNILDDIISEQDEGSSIIKFLEKAYVEDKNWVENKVKYIYTNGNIDEAIKEIRSKILSDFNYYDSNRIDNLYKNSLEKMQNKPDRGYIENLIQEKINSIKEEENSIIDYKIEQLVDIERMIKEENFYGDFCKMIRYKYFNYKSIIEKQEESKSELVEEIEQIRKIKESVDNKTEIVKMRGEIELVNEQVKKNNDYLERMEIYFKLLNSNIHYTKDVSEVDEKNIIKKIHLTKEHILNEEAGILQNYIEKNYVEKDIYIYSEPHNDIQDDQLTTLEKMIVSIELRDILSEYLKEADNKLYEKIENRCIEEIQNCEDVKKHLHNINKSYYNYINDLIMMKDTLRLKIQDNIDRLSKEYNDVNDIEIKESFQNVVANININDNIKIDELEFEKEIDILIKNIEIENFKNILVDNIRNIEKNSSNKLENTYELYLNFYDKIKQEDKSRAIMARNNEKQYYRIENNNFGWILNENNKSFRSKRIYNEIQGEFEKEFVGEFGYEDYSEREVTQKFNSVRRRIISNNENLNYRDEIEEILRRVYKEIKSNSILEILSTEREKYIRLKEDIIIEKLNLIIEIYVYIKLREYLLNEDNEKIIKLSKELREKEQELREYGLSAYLKSRKYGIE